MAFKLIITWHNAGPHTIWGKLETKLGREPTRAEAADEVRRILEEAECNLATAGHILIKAKDLNAARAALAHTAPSERPDERDGGKA